MARSGRAPAINGVLQRSGLSDCLPDFLSIGGSSRHRVETVRSNRGIWGWAVSRHYLLRVECRLRISSHDGASAPLCRRLAPERHFPFHHPRVVLPHESPVTL